jgi:hypothetical protein
MFYLTQFFKSLGDSLFRGFAFFLFSCLLAFSLTHRPWIAKSVEAITPEKMVNPYFVTVMDGSVSPDKIRLAADHLPGVLGVTSVDGEGQNKLQKLVASLGPDYAVDSNLMNFKSFRIVLNPSLSTESLDFIRGQIVKAGGSDHMTASDIKFPEVTSVMNAHPFYRFLGKAGDWGVIGILAVFWVISFWLAYDVFRSHSYLIEKFQRRKYVAAKTIATGLGLIVISFSALAIWNGTLKFFDLILLMMVFSVFWTFSMQDWRWKT